MSGNINNEPKEEDKYLENGRRFYDLFTYEVEENPHELLEVVREKQLGLIEFFKINHVDDALKGIRAMIRKSLDSFNGHPDLNNLDQINNGTDVNRYYDAYLNMSIKVFEKGELGFIFDESKYNGANYLEEFFNISSVNESLNYFSEINRLSKLVECHPNSTLSNENWMNELITAENNYVKAWDPFTEIESTRSNADGGHNDLYEKKADFDDFRIELMETINLDENAAVELIMNRYTEMSFSDAQTRVDILGNAKKDLQVANKNIFDRTMYLTSIHKSNGDNLDEITEGEDHTLSYRNGDVDNNKNLIGMGYISYSDMNIYESIKELKDSEVLPNLFDRSLTAYEKYQDFFGEEIINNLNDISKIGSGLKELGGGIGTELVSYVLEELTSVKNRDMLNKLNTSLRSKVNNASYGALSDDDKKIVTGINHLASVLLGVATGSVGFLAGLAISTIFDTVSDSITSILEWDRMNTAIDVFLGKYNTSNELKILEVIAPDVQREIKGVMNYGFNNVNADSTIRNLIIGNNEDNEINILNGNNNVVKAKNGNDVITGSKNVDYLYGEEGKDTFDSGAGNDFLYGGSDKDTYIFRKGHGVDTIVDSSEGESVLNSIKVMDYSKNDSYLAINDDNELALRFDEENDEIILNEFDNYTFDNIAFNDGSKKVTMYTINGYDPEVSNSSEYDSATILDNYDGNGLDLVIGQASNDTFDTHDGNDTIFGNYGDDIIDAGAGNDILYGGGDDDILYGDSKKAVIDEYKHLYDDYGNIREEEKHRIIADDKLYGGSGNDKLYGQLGDDYLEGGIGDDTYYYNKGDGVDTIVEIKDLSLSTNENKLIINGYNMSDAYYQLVEADIERCRDLIITFNGNQEDKIIVKNYLVENDVKLKESRFKQICFSDQTMSFDNVKQSLIKQVNRHVQDSGSVYSDLINICMDTMDLTVSLTEGRDQYDVFLSKDATLTLQGFSSLDKLSNFRIKKYSINDFEVESSALSKDLVFTIKGADKPSLVLKNYLEFDKMELNHNYLRMYFNNDETIDLNHVRINSMIGQNFNDTVTNPEDPISNPNETGLGIAVVLDGVYNVVNLNENLEKIIVYDYALNDFIFERHGDRLLLTVEKNNDFRVELIGMNENYDLSDLTFILGGNNAFDAGMYSFNDVIQYSTDNTFIPIPELPNDEFKINIAGERKSFLAKSYKKSGHFMISVSGFTQYMDGYECTWDDEGRRINIYKDGQKSWISIDENQYSHKGKVFDMRVESEYVEGRAFVDADTITHIFNIDNTIVGNNIKFVDNFNTEKFGFTYNENDYVDFVLESGSSVTTHEKSKMIGSNAGESFDVRNKSIVFAREGNDTISLFLSDNQDSYIDAGAGDDLILAGGNNCNSIIIGGKGNDKIYTNNNYNTYIFDEEYGDDIIKLFSTTSLEEDFVIKDYELYTEDELALMNLYRCVGIVKFKHVSSFDNIEFRFRKGSSSLFVISNEDETIEIKNFYSMTEQGLRIAMGEIELANGDKKSFKEIAKYLNENGNVFDDHLFGFSDDDVLNGYGGNDILRGMYGDDLLIGGLGNDTYVIDSSNLFFGCDTIDNRDEVELRCFYLTDLSLPRLLLLACTY